MASDSEGPPAKRPREGTGATVKALKDLLQAGSPRLQLVEESGVGDGRKRKSQVWEDFSRVVLDDEPTQYVACRRCRKLIKNVPGHEGSGTSSMQRHTEAHKKAAPAA